MLPAAARLPEVPRLIAQQSTFVIHAPRQSGKTTAILEMAAALTAEGRYAAAVVSAEVGAPFGDDPATAEQCLMIEWRMAIAAQLPPEIAPPPGSLADVLTIGQSLSQWTMSSPRPLVVFVGEIDAPLTPVNLQSHLDARPALGQVVDSFVCRSCQASASVSCLQVLSHLQRPELGMSDGGELCCRHSR